MEIEFDELISRVTAIDGAQLVTGPVLQELVRLVTANVRKELAREQSLLNERRLGADSNTLGRA